MNRICIGLAIVDPVKCSRSWCSIEEFFIVSRGSRKTESSLPFFTDMVSSFSKR